MTFVKLLKGSIVFVDYTDPKTGVIFGINLESPYLRLKTFLPSQVEWEQKVSGEEINKALRSESYYAVGSDCKHHPRHVTIKRYATFAAIISRPRQTSATA